MTHNTRNIWTDWGRLVTFLNVGSKDELQAWAEGKLFKPAFMELDKEVIAKEREEAKKKGINRPRGFSLDTVQKQLIAGERAGLAKYSARHVDKADWVAVDHYAYFLYCVKADNTSSCEGLFFNHSLDDSELDNRIWLLLKRFSYDLTDSRKATSSGARIFGENPQRKKARTGTGHDSDVEELLDEDAVGDLFKGGPQAKGQAVKSHFKTDDEEAEAEEQRAAARAAEMVVQSDVIIPSSAIIIDNAQRMKLERVHSTMQITDRWWQHALINAAAKAGSGPPDYIDQLGHIYEDDRMNDAQSIAWESEVAKAQEKNTIAYCNFDETAAMVFDQQQAWFNNELYQREDVEESCTDLQVANPSRPRLEGMPLACHLQVWQVVAIHAISVFRRGPLCGCVIADCVGLGKTWTAIGYILSRINARARVNLNDREVAKPTIIVVPLNLIDQWMEEIARVAPGLRVWKYWGDVKSQPKGLPNTITHTLNKSHHLFSGKDGNEKNVVVTTYQTWASRHGVHGQRNWRLSNGYSKAATEVKSHEYDPHWPQGLNDVFDVAILDEAHIIKNDKAQLNIALSWLGTFYVALTASMTMAGARDFGGYHKLLEPADAPTLWSTAKLTEFGVDPDTLDTFNPYDLPVGHPASVLQLTLRAAQKWIYPSQIPTPIAGIRLQQLWSQCILRRTHASRIPFKSDKTIGENLPRVNAKVIETCYTTTEQALYNDQADLLFRRLVYSDQKTRQPKWSFPTLRKISLCCIWIQFHHIEQMVRASTMRRWATDPLFIWRWLKEISKKVPEFELPPQADRLRILAALCRGSAKLRTTLLLLADIVIRDQQKTIIWCMYPATQLLIYGALQLVGISCILFYAGMTPDERSKAISTFNDSEKLGMVFVGSYMVGSCGLNLQKRCWNIINFDTPPSDPMAMQAVGRARRMGNPSNVVNVFEIHNRKTFNDRLVENNIRKSLPTVMAELNKQLFNGHGEGQDMEAYDDDLDLGDFLIHNEGLYREDDPEIQGIPNLKHADTEDILRWIIKSAKGEHIFIGSQSATKVDEADNGPV